jgi:hypothetical protein
MFTRSGAPRILLVFAALLAITLSASADVVYENFGPNDQFDEGTGWNVGWGYPLIEVGEPFRVSGGSYTLDSIEVPIGLLHGENHFFLRVTEDNNGKPGKLVDLIDVFDAMKPWVTMTEPILVPSQHRPVLEQGKRYWIVAGASVETFAVWSMNSIGDNGPHGQKRDRDPWVVTLNKRSAFRVNGTPLDGGGR